MENRKNSQGIFYAVIGIATLVVTMIGATFAFFSATTNSTENAITARSGQVSLGFKQDTSGLKTNLIPVNESDPAFAAKVGIGANDCKDLNGNNICSVYQFIVCNGTINQQTGACTFDSSSPPPAQTVYAKLDTQTNEFVNLRYAIFKGTTLPTSGTPYADSATAVSVTNPGSSYGSSAATLAADGSLIIKSATLPAAGASHLGTADSDPLANMRQTLSAGTSVTYTIVMWLHDSGKDQSDTTVLKNQVGTATGHVGNTNETNSAFAGGITFTTAGSNSGVTGVLSASN